MAFRSSSCFWRRSGLRRASFSFRREAASALPISNWERLACFVESVYGVVLDVIYCSCFTNEEDSYIIVPKSSEMVYLS